MILSNHSVADFFPPLGCVWPFRWKWSPWAHWFACKYFNKLLTFWTQQISCVCCWCCCLCITFHLYLPFPQNLCNRNMNFVASLSLTSFAHEFSWFNRHLASRKQLIQKLEKRKDNLFHLFMWARLRETFFNLMFVLRATTKVPASMFMSLREHSAEVYSEFLWGGRGFHVVQCFTHNAKHCKNLFEEVLSLFVVVMLPF